MGYKIFELKTPEILEKKEWEGYSMKTTNGIVLEEMDFGCGYFDTYESAMSFIRTNCENMKHKELVILPTVQINYEGKIINDTGLIAL